MPQGDFFSNLNNMIGKMDQLKKANVIDNQQQENYLNKMLSYYDAINAKKKAGREWDLQTQNIWQNMKRFAKDMAEDAENLKKAKKDIEKSEQEIKKLNEVEAKLIANGNKEAAKMVGKKREQLKLEKEILEVNAEVAESSVSGIGKAFNFLGKTGGFLKTNFGFIGDIFSGILGTAWNIGKALFDIVFPIEKAFKMFLEMQKVVGAVSADIGLTQKEYFGLLSQMPDLYNRIIDYGGKIEDIGKIIRGFSETTGKNKIFSTEEIAAITKLGYSTGLGVEGMTKMVAEFDNLGLSLGRTVKVAQKGREEAAKFNVNQTKVLQTTNEVIKSLAGTAFGRSVEDLTRLAAKAESLRFNLAESINSFKDAFFSPEKAVEAAAKIQVLGGEFAQMFGNPFDLMYESMNNADGMAEKLIGAAKNLAVRNKNGMFEIPPAQRQIIKEVLEALGQSERYPDIINAATEQAKVGEKMAALAKSGKNLTMFTDDQRQQIANLMTLNKNGEYEITMGDGTKKLLNQITSSDQLKTILDQRAANDKAAQERLTLSERFSNMLDHFAIGLTPLFTHLNELLENTGVMKSIEDFGRTIGTTLINWSNSIFTPGGTLSTGFTNFFNSFKGFIDKILAIAGDKDTTFFQKIQQTFGEIASFVIKTIMPYVEYIFGNIFMALKDVPVIGDTLNLAGEQLIAKSFDGGKNKDIVAMAGGRDVANKMLVGANENKSYAESSGNVFTRGGSSIYNLLAGTLNSIAAGGAKFAGDEKAYKEISRDARIDLQLSGAQFVDAIGGMFDWNGRDEGAGGLFGLKGGSVEGWTRQRLQGSENYNPGYQMIPKDTKDAVAFANGKTILGGPGDALAFIQENALGQAYANNFGGDGTITVNISGTMTHETEQGNVELTAQQLYSSNPVLMGNFVNTILEQHGYGSGNYKTQLNVAPI